MTTGRAPRELLASGLVVAPGVYDGLSATLVQNTGFPAAHMTGAGVSVCALGLPDIGLTTLTEMRDQAALICRRLSIPFVADAEALRHDDPHPPEQDDR